jgi:hypothetical protein
MSALEQLFAHHHDPVPVGSEIVVFVVVALAVLLAVWLVTGRY